MWASHRHRAPPVWDFHCQGPFLRPLNSPLTRSCSLQATSGCLGSIFHALSQLYQFLCQIL